MKKLNKSQYNEAVEVLINAFYNDEFFNYVYLDPKDKDLYMKHNFLSWILYCNKYGEVFYEEDNGKIIGVMGYLHPMNDRFTQEMMEEPGFKVEDQKIPQEFILRRQEVTAAFTPVENDIPENSIYFFFVGVHPDYQGKGYGKKLIQKILDYSTETKSPIYLDTEEEQNKNMYEKLGFRIINEDKQVSPIPVWIMVRNLDQ